MKLNRRPRRAMPETIIALIDVVFFLLVFFMLIGRMDATSPFELLPAISQTGTDMPAGGTTVAISADGEIALDGTPLTQADVLAALKTNLETAPDLLVRINAHQNTNMSNLLPLVASIEALGARDIVLVVTPGEG